MEPKPPAPKSSVEFLRKSADFQDLSEYINGLAQVIWDNLSEEKREAHRDMIDEWRGRMYDANAIFEASDIKSKVNIIDQVLPVAKDIFKEMEEFAKTKANVPTEQLSLQNLKLQNEEIQRRIQEILDKDKNV